MEPLNGGSSFKTLPCRRFEKNLTREADTMSDAMKLRKRYVIHLRLALQGIKVWARLHRDQAEPSCVALIPAVTGGFDPADIVTIPTPALTVTEVLAIKAGTIPPPTIGPIIPLFPSIFDGHGLFKQWENVHHATFRKPLRTLRTSCGSYLG